MKHYYSNYELIEMFVEGKIPSGEVIYSYNGNLTAMDKIIWTYNSPLGIKKNGFILVNGDNYSFTSNRHRNMLLECTNTRGTGVAVSFSAISNLIEEFDWDFTRNWDSDDKIPVLPFKAKSAWFDWVEVIDFIPDKHEYHDFKYEWKAEEKMKGYPEDVKVCLERLRKNYTATGVSKSRWNGKLIFTVWGHTAATVLLRIRGLNILAGFDERSYYCSLLPSGACTVKEAFEILKPEPVKRAEAEGKQVLRQGEWFFVKVADDPKEIGLRNKDFKKSWLPCRKGGSRHWCRLLYKDEKIYATGLVRHEGREHRALKLDGIYQAYYNTAIMSVSADSRVD
ncbi:MAG: hypothetical protein DRH57_00150 [Candidatus Cloacimonadota bacterium]|nr:MAG: hypothetical protein DRH57_00150 [Candidatus Cloacimonadota bacterium]